MKIAGKRRLSMPHKNRDASPPNWLWFFLALPLGLIAVLIWQRRQVQSLVRRQRTIIRRARYVEPDSIPIDTRPAFDMADMEEAHHTDHAFDIPEAALKYIQVEPDPVAEQAASQPSDDLKIIEGIGPKIAALLQDHGILTFQQLAVTPLEHLDEILVTANIRRISDPGTWAEQASLAALGDFEALQKLQDVLKAGRRKD
jgi:predicted flap endonuclease-1-like 5' DNA nuclease